MMEESSLFFASYTARDVMLYALSIGYGSSAESYEQDLQFLFEEHPSFAAVPTFVVALTFWAKAAGSDGRMQGIPRFPPPMMKSMGILPKHCLQGDVNLDLFPVLHTWQSISWHQDVPVPTCQEASVETKLQGRFLSVLPKSVGTFVTSQTTVAVSDERHPGNPTLCTIRSTALVLGMPSEHVIPFKSKTFDAIHIPSIPYDQEPNFEMKYTVAPNQALLYRLASGDSNRIHVDNEAVPMMDADDHENASHRPRSLLHGLCTLGIATRAIIEFTENYYKEHFALRHIEGRFTKPVFIHNQLTVKVWCDETPGRDKGIMFVVCNAKDELVVDKGFAILTQNVSEQRSRL